uniref:Uncharacterized protein n=1 Tax=Utricularia reniformis TaxID=192314 RepID=A0A1Y0B3M7_9LAMI|nr:hypothetical protein AEK19_MT0868 [Utricularia reniformis]YP_009382267.1 hypothetical protein AEK19_MT1841 [Utricularia reniformis]ART31100.1 hypothetical protein AEK19_MT0868 [Utricularia reniformis]ART32011.1 hypothetical protein AEK19_MT1841 [Utricularia reniformis]
MKERFTSVGPDGQVEVTNRILPSKQGSYLLLEEIRPTSILPEVRWAYRIIPRSTTSETPFSLVYSTNAVTPVEVGMMSHRLTFYDENVNAELRRADLN